MRMVNLKKNMSNKKIRPIIGVRFPASLELPVGSISLKMSLHPVSNAIGELCTHSPKLVITTDISELMSNSATGMQKADTAAHYH